MTAIIDYGVGNLFSLKCSLAAIGEESLVTGEKDEILRADRVILPGVGAFADAYKKLCDTGMDAAVYAAAPGLYKGKGDEDVVQFRAGKTNNDIK